MNSGNNILKNLPSNVDYSKSFSTIKLSKSITKKPIVSPTKLETISKNKNVMDMLKSHHISLKSMAAADVSMVYDIIQPSDFQRNNFCQCIDRLERIITVTEQKKCKLQTKLKALDEGEKAYLDEKLLKLLIFRDCSDQCHKLQTNLIQNYKKGYSYSGDVTNNCKCTENGRSITYTESHQHKQQELSKNNIDRKQLNNRTKTRDRSVVMMKSTSSVNLIKPIEKPSCCNIKCSISKDDSKLSVTNQQLKTISTSICMKAKGDVIGHKVAVVDCYTKMDHNKYLDESEARIPSKETITESRNDKPISMESSLPIKNIISNNESNTENNCDKTNMLYKILVKFDHVKQLIEKQKLSRKQSKLNGIQKDSKLNRQSKTQDIIDWLKRNMEYQANRPRPSDLSSSICTETFIGSFVREPLSTIYVTDIQSEENNVGNETFNDVTIKCDEASFDVNSYVLPYFTRLNLGNVDNLRKPSETATSNVALRGKEKNDLDNALINMR